MLVFNLTKVLRLRGVENHQHFLKKLGFAYSSVQTFLSSTTMQIKFDQLEALCVALNCTPNDLFEWQPEAEQRVADTHSMNKLKKDDLTKRLSEVPLDQIAELLQNSAAGERK